MEGLGSCRDRGGMARVDVKEGLSKWQRSRNSAQLEAHPDARLRIPDWRHSRAWAVPAVIGAAEPASSLHLRHLSLSGGACSNPDDASNGYCPKLPAWQKAAPGPREARRVRELLPADVTLRSAARCQGGQTYGNEASPIPSASSCNKTTCLASTSTTRHTLFTAHST